MLLGGVYSMADYLSLHVLLCLIPAFFIAGAMIVFVPKDTIVKYMGKDTKKIIAYPVAALSGLLLAVCSCTVLPLFAGIKKKGAGLGPAMTFLFSAPAVNILALTYTGALIGMDIAIARAVLALGFAILIGLIMDLIFKDKSKKVIKEESEEISEEKIDLKAEVTPLKKKSNKNIK
ncbi:MAG: permease, partial [Candidatus Heimdallarchaeota archaeon]|nr:permease [Candidatus Heimdallarchaeota archaeon]